MEKMAGQKVGRSRRRRRTRRNKWKQPTGQDLHIYEMPWKDVSIIHTEGPLEASWNGKKKNFGASGGFTAQQDTNGRIDL